MIVRAECAIDIDEKRRVWVELSAEGDDVDEIVPKLANAAVVAALEGSSRYRARRPEKAGERPSGPPPRRRKDPTDLRGMGELDRAPDLSDSVDPEAAAIVEKVTGE